MTLRYCYRISDQNELLKDDVRVELNQSEIKAHPRVFIKGLIAGLTFSPSIAFADDVANQANQQARKELAKRVSNAVGCTAILAVCKKNGAQQVAEAGMQQAARGGAITPTTLAIFGCGFAVSWCVKYAVFDR